MSDQHSTYWLVWTPELHEDGYSWPGDEQLLALSDDLESMAVRWESKLTDWHWWHPAHAMGNCRLIGKAAETNDYALHVVGRGTLAVRRIPLG